MKDLKDLDNENIVKVITNKNLNNHEFSEAKNFLRTSSEIFLVQPNMMKSSEVNPRASCSGEIDCDLSVSNQ